MTTPVSSDLDDMAYVPLAVAPAPFAPQPNPPPDGIPTLVFTAPPYCWLDIGTPVHLHVAPTPLFFDKPCRCPRARLQTDTLAIRGWVVEERARTEESVVYVVTNEDTYAHAPYVAVQFGPLPGIRPPPSASDANKGWILARTETLVGSHWRADGSSGPLGLAECVSRTRTGSPDRPTRWTPPELEQVPQTRERGLGKAEAGALRGWPGAMTQELERQRQPSRDRSAATLPYTMWETYGGAVLSRDAKNKDDAIRNYGRPIVVRPRERFDRRRV